MSVEQLSLILRSAKDWPNWIEVVKTTARAKRVWEYVDPSVPTNAHKVLVRPSEPSPISVRIAAGGTIEVQTPVTSSQSESSSTLPLQTELPIPKEVKFNDFTDIERTLWIHMQDQYRHNVRAFEVQEIGLVEVQAYIQKHVSFENQHYTHNCDSAYDMLRRLRDRFAPTDRAKKVEAINDWRALHRGFKGPDMDAWLSKWETAYDIGCALQIPDVQGDQPFHDFLDTVNGIHPSWVPIWREKILEEPNAYAFYEVIRRFRDFHRSSRYIIKPRGSHSAFPATLQGRTPEDSKDEDLGSEKKKSKTVSNRQNCVCNEAHRFNDCPYLVDAKRPSNWKPDEKIQKLVENRLKTKDNTWCQAALYVRNKNTTSNPRSSSTAELPTAFTAIAYSKPLSKCTLQSERASDTVFSVSPFQDIEPYVLSKSVILDSGATTHICNDRTRFIDFREASNSQEDQLYAGDSILPIEGYGTVEVQVQRNDNSVLTVKLLNTVFVSSFHTNVVSLRILVSRNVHWDTAKSQLTYDGKHYCKTPQHHGQWVLEYNEVLGRAAAFPAQKTTSKERTLSGTADEWHGRMGHLNQEAVSHLPDSTVGVSITAKPYNHACRTCRLSNAQQVISRRPAIRATQPFERIHLDLVIMNEGLDGEVQMLHFIDDCVRMNFVFTLPNKRQETILNTIQDAFRYFSTQYNKSVRFVRMDGEKSLGNQFISYLAFWGIQLEAAPPYTKEPNGTIERVGRTLTAKARALKESSNLPDSMWAEIYKAAGYLLNRSPHKTLDWETPIGLLNRTLQREPQKPDLSNIRRYGCKAYSLLYNILKKDRLDPRAEEGFLVGYEGTNIYRIWLPHKAKVAFVRDVTFDESITYDPASIPKPYEPTIYVVDFSEVEVEEVGDQQDSVRSYDLLKMSTPSTGLVQKDLSSQTIDQTEKGKETPYAGPPMSVRNSLLTPEATPPPEAQPLGSMDFTQGQAPEDITETQEATHENVRTDPEPAVSSAPNAKPKKAKSGKALKDISGDLNQEHILEGKRTRIPPRRNAYLAALEQADTTIQFHTAFLAGADFHKTRIHRTQLPEPPKFWKHLENHSCRQGFLAAATKEYNDLNSRGTFLEIKEDTVHVREVIPLMWVFTYKFDNNGYLLKYKARLVVRGDMQIASVHNDTYAATLAARVVRALMAIAAYFNLDTIQLDAINAFTNSLLDEDVYVRCPEGFEKPGKVLKLVRALYGLRRSPLLWFRELTSTLIGLGLVQVPEAQCLFVSPFLILFFYVDDVCIFSHLSMKDKVNEFVTKLLATYEFRTIGEVSWFLGIRVVRDRSARKLWLCQDSYIDKLADTFKVNRAYTPATPMATDYLVKYEGIASPQNIYVYQQKVGSINYAAIVTRLDIVRTASKLSEFLTNPSPEHIAAVDRVLAYLVSTKELALEYRPVLESPKFHCSSDASYADNIETRKSTEGYLFNLFGGSIDWRSTRQPTVSTSTTEAELLALSHAAKQLYWWQRFFNMINLDLDEDYVLHCDNLQTVRLMLKETPKLVTKLKHVDIHQHWVRQEVEALRLKIQWITTIEMPADGFTKSLTAEKHKGFVRFLRLVDISSILSKL